MKTLLERLPTLKQIEQEKARRHLLDFTKYTFPDYEINWHHEVIAQYLEEWAFGDIDRLMLFVPPRYGKSELASRRLPAWIFGRDPDAEMITTSYSADLASSMNRDVQRIIDTPEYHAAFPGTTLSRSEHKPTTFAGHFLRNNDIFEIVNREGVYKSAGVGGPITGRGFKYGIIDDPYKNRQDAESKTKRDNVYDWYTSTFYTRKEKGAKILLILTRWHEDDLAGRLLKLAKEDPNADQWEVISFPAIAEGKLHVTDERKEGEPLWKEKFSLKDLYRTKASIGTYEWSALYQQRPSPAGGSIFKRNWFNYYTEAPSSFDAVYQSWDATFKEGESSDFVVGQVWGVKGANKYLLDQTRARMSFPDTIRAIRAMSAKWRQANEILIEDKANGPAIISTLKNEIPGIIPINPEGGKIVRAQAVTATVEAGNVYLPDPSVAPWIKDFIEEAASFPNGSNDDQVDGMTQFLNRLQNEGTAFVSSSNIW